MRLVTGITTSPEAVGLATIGVIQRTRSAGTRRYIFEPERATNRAHRHLEEEMIMGRVGFYLCCSLQALTVGLFAVSVVVTSIAWFGGLLTP